jgi:protein TonB
LVPPSAVAEQQTVRPAYPESARRRGEQGDVLLRVEVAADGQPLEVSVTQGSGFSLLDDAAMAAVRRWHFRPATRGGIPVSATAEVPIRFRLTN